MTPETRKRPYPAKGRPLALNPPENQMTQPALSRVTSSIGGPSTTMKNRETPRGRQSL